MSLEKRDRARAAVAAMRRGEILSLLADAPVPMPGAAILKFFLDLGRDVVMEEVLRELRFLKARGYVTFTERKSRERRELPEVDDVSLTDKGQDVLDRRVKDDAVDVG